MSAPNPHVALATEPREHAGESKFWAYVQIAMLLAVITGVEIVAIGLPFAKWLLVSALVVLSVVKFLFVIFYFMHLRWDKAFCTILFFIGLVLASGTMWALLHLFKVDNSKPLTSVELSSLVVASDAARAA
ncbi:MAG TPA: cytochrome C oxidase subunit IV family protein [Opitutus sp.]|nr:cytochrome C oxidase subunit IV family protein [Opitutus sp.]